MSAMNGSGGFVWKPNSVFQIGILPPPMRPRARAESSTRPMRPYERIVASSAEGSMSIGPAGRVYGW